MTYEAWNWKAIEARIIEMADTLRMTPAYRGPKQYGSAMPEVVRRYDEAYGFETSKYRPQATAAAIARMDECFDWINSYLDQGQRCLVYDWSWVKVRKGMKIGRFAYENGMEDRMLRRSIIRICQRIAANLNRIMAVRLNNGDLPMSENRSENDQSDVKSNNCGTVRKNGIAVEMSPDARPILDTNSPELAALTQRLEEANLRREKEARRRAKLKMAA
jgi:hypothetical protein